MQRPRLEDLKHHKLAKKKVYEARLARLQLDMLEVQRAYHRQGRSAVVVFEGWDAAGKGGAIRRLTDKLDPRGIKVYAVGAPTEQEMSRHYLWRFWKSVPARGQIVVFDRSWYGRVLVERVEKYARKTEWRRAYDEINDFERKLIDDDVRVVKIFLHITKNEQRDRFAERLTEPYKHWKFTADDLRNRARWDDYEGAAEEMFSRTSTEGARWHLVAANDKRFARLSVLEHIRATLREGVDIKMPPVAPELMRRAAKELGLKLKLKSKSSNEA